MKKVLLTASEEKDRKFLCTQKTVHILNDCGIAVYADAELYRRGIFRTQCEEYSGQQVDAVISVGGDGTIMRAASVAADIAAPLLGINMGRVGYLAELEPEELGFLTALRDDKYYLEKRMMLEALTGDGRRAVALNDAVVTNSDRSQIATVSLYCDGNKVSTYRADGLIFSTPTGSTAYSLSAGGPIIDPKLECIVSTPIAPHSLKAKPLVFDSGSVLEVVAEDNRKGKLAVCVDGNKFSKLGKGEKLTVKRSDRAVYLIRIKPGENAFYHVLNNKMID